MKKLNKIILIISFLVVILLLASCTKGEVTRKISISKLKDDIANDTQIQSCFTSAYVKESRYSIETIEIVKEQENENDIITYSNVVLENAYFSISLYIKTIYNYYDHGGWIMDELYIEETKEITPISGPDPDCVEENITQNNTIDVLYEDASEWITNDEYELSVTDTSLINATTAHASAQVQTDVARFEGYFVYAWSENSWGLEEDKQIFYVTNCTIDYTSLLGHFTIDNDLYYEIGGEKHIIFDSFDIEILSVEGTTVTYILNSCDMRTYEYSVVVGEKQQAEFDPFLGQFTIGTYENILGTVPMTVSYASHKEGWNVIASSLKKAP